MDEVALRADPCYGATLAVVLDQWWDGMFIGVLSGISGVFAYFAQDTIKEI